MSQKPESARRVHSLGRFLLIDLLIEKRSRPVLIYVAITASIGAAIYHFVEGWRWLDSFYFVVITMTTIGYGDLSPATDLGRLFTIFFALSVLTRSSSSTRRIFAQY